MIIESASYQTGFAPRDGQPLYPELWRGCVGAWAPCLGPTGLTLRDWSGFAANGVLTNMVTGSDWIVSQGRYCLDYDGTNDFVDIPRNNVALPGLSIAAWIKTTSSGSRQGVISSGAIERLAYIDILATGVLRCAVEDGPSVFIFRDSSIAVNTGAWTHVALTATPTTVAVYINGNAVTTGGGTSGPLGAVNLRSITIGKNVGTPYGGPFLGQIDDSLAYSRVLSQNEILLLASRRGIAYEMAPRRVSSSAVQFNRRRRLLVGAGS